MKFAVSSYSFHRLGRGPEEDRQPDFFALLKTGARLGFDGVTLHAAHFPSTAPADLYALKQHAFRHGLDIVAVSAYNNFIHPDPQRRADELKSLRRWVSVAHELGAPCVRVFSGRWGTQADTGKIIAARGEEEPLPGYTAQDGFTWTIEALGHVAEDAGRQGVTLALENHWGFTPTAQAVIRVIEAVNSPWLRAVIDIGNFYICDDPYAEIAALTPYMVMIHTKTYLGGGIWYTADLDYSRVAQILDDAGFHGWAALEFEGKAHPEEGVPHGLAVMKACFGH